jgi:peroxiredoxin
MTENRQKSSGNQVAIWLIGLGAIAIVVVIVVMNVGQAVHPPGPAAGESLSPGATNMGAPDLTLTTVDGRELSLADLQGRAVLVNFWATWCPPCRREMADLQQFHLDNQDAGIVVVAINAGESAAQVEQFAQEYGLTFDLLLDPAMQALADFRVSSLPTSIFIDREGKIHGRHTGQIVRQQMDEQMAVLR